MRIGFTICEIYTCLYIHFFKLIHHYSGICWQWFAINNTLHWNGAFVGCEILGALANNCVRGAVCKLLALAGLPIQQPATLDGGKKSQ